VPYEIDGVIGVRKKLTIEAGTTLQFQHGSGIKIEDFDSALVAMGTSTQPIIFTGVEETPGFWNGLYFLNTNETGSTTARSRLHHTVVEFGGGELHLDSNAEEFRGNIMLDGSGYNIAVEVQDSIIRKSSGYGIWLDCLAHLTNTNNTFAENPSGDIGQEKDCN
jgi:hypothetical protein